MKGQQISTTRPRLRSCERLLASEEKRRSSSLRTGCQWSETATAYICLGGGEFTTLALIRIWSRLSPGFANLSAPSFESPSSLRRERWRNLGSIPRFETAVQ